MSLLAFLVLACATLQDPSVPAAPVAPVAPAADAKAELIAVCATFAKANSYAFELSSEGSGGGPGGGRGRRGGEGAGDAPSTPRPPVVTKARVQSGKPLHLVQGDVEGYVLGETLVVKNADGTFEKLDREAMRGRGFRPGRVPRDEGGTTPPAGGADAPKAEGGSPPQGEGQGAPPTPRAAGGAEGRPAGGEGGPREGRGGFGMMGLLQVRAPHKLAEQVGAGVEDVAKSERDGKVVYSGKLNQAAIDVLMPMGGMRMRGGEEGDMPERTASGTFEIVVGPQGAIESILLDTQMSISFGERTMERKSKSTYTITDLDHVEVTVPEAAQAMFEV